jgi:hypothetical protein
MKASFSIAKGLLASACVTLLVIVQAAAAQPPQHQKLVPKHLAVLRAGRENSNSRIVRPHAAFLLSAGTTKATARINVKYTGFTPAAQKAFQAAVDVWGSTLKSDVIINVNANFKNLGDPRILGSAGPTTLVKDFAHAPKPGTFYPIALANKLAGTDLEPSEDDIDANFNSTFPNWYFGTDGLTPVGQYDFMSVVLHELGHGLGFIGSGSTDTGGTGSLNDPQFAYDLFVQNGSGQKVLDSAQFPNPSAKLGQEFTGQNLFFSGPLTNSAHIPPGLPARLYAPTVWEDGSSYSHLDEATFPAGDPNSLMTPQLGMNESIHTPGGIVMSIFRDMGW